MNLIQPQKSKQQTDTLPVNIITGFLGSGKTTLLNSLLKHSDMKRTAVLVNEFGDIGIDHLLVETITDDIILLQSGCICCQIRDDLATTLSQMYEKSIFGELEPFTRVLIETTGIANPIPVIQTIISDSTLTPRFHLGNIIAVLDGVHAIPQLNKHDESIKQVMLADILIISKTDLAEPESIKNLHQEVQRMNPQAAIQQTIKGNIQPSILFEKKQRNIAQWQHLPEQYNTIQGLNHIHNNCIASACISIKEAIDWQVFSSWLDSLIHSRAENILRIKGMLNISGEQLPLVIQGVQHTVYPPTALTKWPNGKRESQLVFITYNLDPEIIKQSLYEYFELDKHEV